MTVSLGRGRASVVVLANGVGLFSEHVVAAVAVRLVIGRFTAAEVKRPRGRRGEAQGFDAGALMGPVAERLCL